MPVRSTFSTLGVTLAFGLLASVSSLSGAEDSRKNIPQGNPDSPERYPDWRQNDSTHITEQDWAGTVNKYYGQRHDQFADDQRRIAKVDLDGDLNYDGVISNDDPADSGAFERTPPGLMIGVGEMSKLIVRVTPYRVDYQGEAVVSLEVTGINRAVRSGLFENFAEEVSKTSRIRVWADAERQKLLLDSHDAGKRRVEWSLENGRMAPGNAITGMNLPFQSYPRRVYVEGLKPHGPFIGDTRLLLSVEHREVKPGQPSQPKTLERFRSAWETFLVTVTDKPQPKEFVVSEALQDIWIRPHGSVAQRP